MYKIYIKWKLTILIKKKITARHILFELQKINDKENIQIIHKKRQLLSNRADWKRKREAKKQQNAIFKGLKENNYQTRILYPVKIFVKNEVKSTFAREN